MPELKHNFIKGRMNKDLDERLVPNGEYRDALNIEVVNSEGDDVGSAQTTMGNVLVGSTPAGTCVGSIADEKNDKLYYLVHGLNGTNYIAEYDYVQQIVTPVLVDVNGGVLNFDSSTPFLITGINIIDDMLFWTDNNTEPKHINITRCKYGSVDFVTHTDFYTTQPGTTTLWLGHSLNVSRPIEEKHITVIKESPKTPPALEMKNTIEGKIGGTISNHDFTIGGVVPDVDAIPPPTTVITLDAGDYSYEQGDILLLTTTNINADELQIRVQVDIVNPTGSNTAQFEVIILAIDANVLSIDTLWDVELEQKAALFHLKFPRFGYRYKYEDGEYSTFSPFTEVAFLPKGGDFDYHPKKGFNLSMVNDVRHLAVKDFVSEEDILPDGVVSIDILYKESNSPNIYSVKTIERNSEEWSTRHRIDSSTTSTLIDSSDPGWLNQFIGGHDYRNTKGYVKITSELIHATLPENQLLRPWDNVPRKALAQEVSGNRLIYGNYLQNYNVSPQSLEVGLFHQDLNINPLAPEQIYPVNAYDYYPAKSVKSLRTYQLGVVYIDEYGRETPVFSEDDDNNSSIYLEKKFAVSQNKLTGKILSTPPSWAKSFKFFIKETSNEYYNLAVDRWYDAEDDNVWLSFPSSERNKLDEDTVLILKKRHDGSGFVEDAARYKVLAIDNEAPSFITETIKSFGVITDSSNSDYFADGSGAGFPLEGYTFVWIDKSPYEDQGWHESLVGKGNLFIRVVGPSTKSQWYSISSISLNTQSGSHYQVNLQGAFKEDVAFTSTDGTYNGRVSGLKIEIMQKVKENKAEFDGRFFVKIHKDLTLQQNLLGDATDNSYYVIKLAKRMPYINSRSAYNEGATYAYIDPGTGLARGNKAWFGWDAVKSKIEYIRDYGGLNGDHWYWDKIRRVSGDPNDRGSWFIDEQQAFVDAASDQAESYYEPIEAGTALDWPLDGTAGKWHDADNAGYQSPDHTNHDTVNWSYAIPENTIVAPRRGISRETSRINISFSGIGRSEDGDGTWDEVSYFTGGNSNVNADNVSHSATPLENWSWYVSEVFFINTLTTSGCLWRFKEDPDLVVYKTEGSTWRDLLANYTQSYESQITWGGGISWMQALLWDIWEEHTGSTNQAGNAGYPTGSVGGGWPVASLRNGCSEGFDDEKMCYSRNFRRSGYNFHAKALVTGLNPGEVGGDCVQGYLPTNPPNWVYDNGITHQIREYNMGGCLVQVDLRPRVDMSLPDSAANTRDGVMSYHPLYKIDEPLLTDGTANPNYIAGMENTDTAPNNPKGYAPGIRHDGMMNGESADFAFGPEITIGESGPPGCSNHYPGTSTIEILEQKDPGDIKYSSHNPAIFETEPKEDVGMDIYHEIGQEYPITLDSTTNEQYIPLGSIVSGPGVPSDIRVFAINDNVVTLKDDAQAFIATIALGSELLFRRPNGSMTSAVVNDIANAATGQYGLNPSIYQQKMYLPWFNCYSFGNGVESDRIRDNFNQVTIDNGPKASTTLEEPYKKERRCSGLIYSGIYNSISGVNNLNQFVQAEKITKDVNPTYGCIQKLHSRNTDLLTLCEDKVLTILANKDAMFNADGNTNVTSNLNVLGQAMPASKAEYGISKNPESFASQANRVYFADKTRGTVLRFGQDGLVPISSIGMKDYFSDNLRNADTIIGSFDDKKGSYNITFNSDDNDITLTYTEAAKGWTSFKSFIQENGLSMNNSYYTLKQGKLWQHHTNQVRNNFYGNSFDASIKFIFNDIPSSVKSFNTLNYEGSQARITQNLNDPDYYNNVAKPGWYVDMIQTNLQTGNNLEFKDKEGKWFATVKGETTTLQNLDTQEFSVQGIGNADSAGCPSCIKTWECVNSIKTINDCDNLMLIRPLNPFTTEEEYLDYVSDPSNGYHNDLADNLYSCVHAPLATTAPVFGDTCECDNGNGSLLKAYKVVLLVQGLYSGNSIPYTTWTDFLTNEISNWSTWAPSGSGPCPITLGMTYYQVKAAIVSWGIPYGIKPKLSIIETRWCQCQQITECECVEIQGTQGHPTKADCENAQNCCGTTNHPLCLPCSDPNADTSVPGCCDNTQQNYNPLATCDDGTCIPIIYGCTDPTALNYNAAATVDDGSCMYSRSCCDTSFVTIPTHAGGNTLGVTLGPASTCPHYGDSNFLTVTAVITITMPNGQYYEDPATAITYNAYPVPMYGFTTVANITTLVIDDNVTAVNGGNWTLDVQYQFVGPGGQTFFQPCYNTVYAYYTAL